jgi:hypothetical protein
LCDHAGGHTRFAADWIGQAGEAERVVLADNRSDWERSF